MFNMIAYISTPYTLESLESQNNAVQHLNKFLGRVIYKREGWTGVSSVFTLYNNTDLHNKAPTYKQLYATSKILIESCDLFMVLGGDNWGYSEIVMNELFYAQTLKKPIEFFSL